MTAPHHDTMDLADYIRELTETHTHREHYTIRHNGTWYGANHITTAPPLMAQLWAADTPSNAVEDGPRAAYTSRPAARLEALDVAVRIDLEVARWVRDLGEDDPGDTADCLRLFHGLLASAPEVTRRAALRDVRRWWTQARVATGWDSPAWKPDNTCPVCGARGSLRVNLAAQGAFCTDCRETWDHSNIGLLADHIRAESHAEKQPKQPRGACWCPWPKPIVPDLSVQCAGCGSARCRHALLERGVVVDDRAS